uniref:CCHC-type domain-containing protein n=1 Tax=Bracon brevicornis TaxID=1563983 RepID=A0A6V7KQ38_9HYME
MDSPTKVAPPATANYASAARNEVFPTEEQAVIIPAIEDTNTKIYAKAIASKVSSNSIRYIQKISNQRICCYLSTAEIANQLVEDIKSIEINGQQLPIRPLISKNKRIIISNAPPHIPHTYVEKLFSDHKIELKSQISFIKAGMNEEGLNHICCFRRQVLIKGDDVGKIPSQVRIQYNGTNYFVYIETDDIKCFNCKQHGHMARNCPTLSVNTDIHSNKPNDSEGLKLTQSPIEMPHTSTSTTIENDNNDEIPQTNNPTQNQTVNQEPGLDPLSQTSANHQNQTEIATLDLHNDSMIQMSSAGDDSDEDLRGFDRTQSEAFKRPLPASSTSSEPPLQTLERAKNDDIQSESEYSDDSNGKANHLTKKRKKIAPNPPDFDGQLQEIKKEIDDNPLKYPLDYSQLKNLLGKATKKNGHGKNHARIV